MKALAMVAMAVVLTACASTSGSTPGRQRDRISQEEVANSTVGTAYELVESLRPEYLRSRGSTSLRNPTPEQPVVYVDGVRAGGLEILRNMPRDIVEEIRYMNSADATTMYGTGHGGGVIQVRTRRG